MADRIHRALGAAALAVVATGFVGWRSLRRSDAAAPGAASTAVPSPQLRQLIPFAAPLADSQLVVRSLVDSVPVRHDPFTVAVPERVAATSSGTAAAPRIVTQSDSTQWHVSATLISSTRRAAVINDVLTYVGDRVPGGGKLMSVESDRVVLTDSRGASHTVKADKEGT